MHDFSDKSQDAEVVLTFDFTDELGSDPITSVDSITVTLLSGDDPYPEAMLDGAATINTDGSAVLQRIIGGVNGNDYRITALVSTASETLPLAGTLRVREAT